MSNNNDRYEEIKSSADKVASEILMLTRNGLFVTLRFLDVALCQFNFISDDNTEKLATTGQTLMYNTKYVISRYLKEKQVLSHDYLHIVMHCIFRHPFVSDKLDRTYWDLATDIAVEAIICDLEVKQAETDDSVDIRQALEEIGGRVGKLTAERIYNFLVGGGLTAREINRYSKIFFRDEHEIWWEMARKLKEEAEREAKEEAEKNKNSDKSEQNTEDEETPETEEQPEESEDEENGEDQGGDEADNELDDDQGEEAEDEDSQDGEGESEGDDSDERPGDEESEQGGSDEDEGEDDEPDNQFVTGNDHPDDEDGEQPDGMEDPEGGSSMDKRDHDGTKDESEGETGENKDAQSQRGSEGRTGSGENEGNEESGEPDEGGSMQQGAQEPRIGDMPDQKQPQSTRNKSNPKKSTANQKDEGSSGSGGGDSVQAAWQHQSGGGAKKGEGGGTESETRPELEGEHKSAGAGGDDQASKDEKGERSRGKMPSDDSDPKYSQEKLDELEKKWREISERLLVDLETSSKEWGDKSDAMLQSLKNINRDRYDYTTFLKKFSVFREDIQINPDEFDYVYYTYGFQHYGNMPLVEPLEYREVKKINEFVIAIDTSGSCTGEVVQKFLDKTYSILTQQENFFRKINVHILQCDAEIQEAVKITSQAEFEDYLKTLEFKGFGGTDFRPVFEYVNYMIEQGEFRDLKGLIYFTDGNGTYPLKRPKYDTAFVFVDDNEFEYEVPSWAIKLVLETSDILEEDKVRVNV